jgi:acetaldehyde dehydrogenase/alcohol dehydrogenase
MALPEPLNLLSADEQAILSRYMQDCTIPAGEYIFRAGEAGDSCYLIDKGDVRLELPRRKLNSDGLDSDPVLGYLRAGSILGELSLLDRLPRSASACADTAVTARRISSEGIEELCSHHPAIGVGIVRALGRDAALKLRKTNERLAEHIIGDEPDHEADEMIARAQAAQAEFVHWSEERVNALLHDLAHAFAAKVEMLARLAVQETRIGNVSDKVDKNLLASLYVLESLNGKIGYGVLETDKARRVTEIAAPAGVVFGIIPMTNPAATAIFKALIALKGRNALILSPQRTCMRVGNAVGEIISGVLAKHGAPADIIQWVQDRNSRKRTAYFMGHKGVSLILATGGAGMVEAAYSSGTPALGVGPGNTPTLIAPDADLDHTAEAIALSKSFDNGLICGAEHNLVVVESVVAGLTEAFERAGVAVLSPDEATTFAAAALRADGLGWRRQTVGQTAQHIAEFTGIKRDYRIRVIVVPTEFDLNSPFAEEKMLPVLSLFTVPDVEAGIDCCLKLLAHQGAGHTSSIYSKDEALIDRFGLAMPTSRILVNSPGVQGVFGLTSGLIPSLTLGCGTFGGNSTTDNVTYHNLLNIKRMARYIELEESPI